MIYKASSSYYKVFSTLSPYTGAAVDADSTPTATANKNGTTDATFTLTVTKITTGVYKITGTVPSTYAAGDILNIYVSATVASVATVKVVDTFNIDTYRLSDIGGYVSGANITTTSPVASDENITIYTYDDYDADESRALEWSNSAGTWGDGDITSGVVEFRMVSNLDSTDDFPATGNKSGTVVTATGTQMVRVELTSAETALLTAGENVYTYHLRLTDDSSSGHKQTLATGYVTVIATKIA